MRYLLSPLTSCDSLLHASRQTGRVTCAKVLASTCIAGSVSPSAWAETGGSPALPWIIAAAGGWILCVVLAAYLLVKQRLWRVAFENKDWLILPSDTGHQLASGLQSLEARVSDASHLIAKRVEQTNRAAEVAAEETKGAREEFGILRHELDIRQKELKAMQLGQEFHHRRSALLRIIRAIEIINDDMANQREPEGTLEGVRVELAECLDDNRVVAVKPSVGQRVGDAADYDPGSARRQPATDPALRGTVASVECPAYIATGPNGQREVLVQARVTIFV